MLLVRFREGIYGTWRGVDFPLATRFSKGKTIPLVLHGVRKVTLYAAASPSLLRLRFVVTSFSLVSIMTIALFSQVGSSLFLGERVKYDVCIANMQAHNHRR
jgi:hypothetical protein